MCDLRALDVVECIDDTPVLKQSAVMPKAGHLYRVQSVRRVGDGFSVRLFELSPKCHLGGPCNCGNCGWDSGRFRLAHRREEDKLSILRAFLSKMETRTGVVPEVVD
jgi:hypothetical protein